MSCVGKTNKFFDKTYNKLGNFATSPFTGWSLLDGASPEAQCYGMGFDILFKVALSPVLFVPTMFTASLALVGALFAAILHVASLLIASVIDLCSPEDDKQVHAHPSV